MTPWPQQMSFLVSGLLIEYQGPASKAVRLLSTMECIGSKPPSVSKAAFSNAWMCSKPHHQHTYPVYSHEYTLRHEAVDKEHCMCAVKESMHCLE